VTRSGKSAKQAFETVFSAMVSVLERSLIPRRLPRQTKAQSIAALCVGGMVVARAMADRTHADELRDACMSVALKLGGWEHEGTVKNGTSKRRLGAASS
jgi:TetR/AcrR family transcriptional repressor of nem operon